MTCLLFSLDFSLVSVDVSVRGRLTAILRGRELTWVGEVRLVTPDLRRDLLLALGELLHVVGHD